MTFRGFHLLFFMIVLRIIVAEAEIDDPKISSPGRGLGRSKLDRSRRLHGGISKVTMHRAVPPGQDKRNANEVVSSESSIISPSTKSKTKTSKNTMKMSSKTNTMKIAPKKKMMMSNTGKGKGKGKGKGSLSVFDVDGDGDEELEDLILLLRLISDPFQILPPGDPRADVNRDGVVDINDAIAMIARLIEILGETALGSLNTTYFDNDDNFPWNQPPLPPDRRLNLRMHGAQGISSYLEPDKHRSTQRRDDGIPPSGTSSLVKGPGPDPTINWDFDNCERDITAYANLSLLERARAHASWVKYGALNVGAAVLLPDASRAYSRYRSNTGAELSVNYEKAIMDDATIKEYVDREIAGVKADVLNLFNGEAFEFHALNARGVPNGATENWQKTLGGHRIWSKGSVTIDETNCQLLIDFTIFVEDYYNFNPGQTDIASGLPDDDNCLFAILGWARPFFSRGSVDRSTSVDLECCEDDDCSGGEVCRDYKCVLTCPGTQQSGGQGTTRFSVDLTQRQGTFTVSYNMYSIPDELTVSHEGSIVFSTGGLVSGSATTTISYGSSASTSTVVDVVVRAPNSGTAWVVSVTCAEF